MQKRGKKFHKEKQWTKDGNWSGQKRDRNDNNRMAMGVNLSRFLIDGLLTV